MAGIDDHDAIAGDWMPPSLSPRTFSSAVLGDDISLRSSEALMEKRMGVMEKFEDKDETQAGVASDQLAKSNAISEQKTSSSGGLLERIAARAGFNAPRLNTESIRPSSDLSLKPGVRSPCLTIPPGLSPTTLLESPVFLSNSMVHPSPTTGKFPFVPGSGSPTFTSEAFDKGKNFFEDLNISSHAFKPVAELCLPLSFGTEQTFPSVEVSVQPDSSLQSQSEESAEKQLQNGAAAGGSIVPERRAVDTVGGSMEHSPPPDGQQDEEEADQRGNGDGVVSAPSDDGYNWRKYGQKQVKGSEYPRSYYKCTHPSCPVKKKVERSHEGQITEIIYSGTHNHPKPPPNRRSAIGFPNPPTDNQLNGADQTGAQIGFEGGDPVWISAQKASAAEVSPAVSMGAECRPSHFELGDAVDGSSISNNEEEDDQGAHGSVSLGYDGEEDGPDSKRRKIEAYASEMSGTSRAVREPRVVVQTTSEVDILDDGYRWRKYGQKVVKGNPNPRSYYKCTSPGCPIRKHVERASHDLKSVITTYEGKHNHDVPAARSSSHVNSCSSINGPALAGNTVTTTIPTPLNRLESFQFHNSMARTDRPPFSSFALRQQLGPPLGFAFGMNQPGLANLGMSGLRPNPNLGKLPVLPIHPHLGQQRPVNEMGFLLPKGELKVDPLPEPTLNLSNRSLLYDHFMSRHPLGPQM
ncbi:hypothetical protein NMG60_11002005 [Bertholletia excelsa]